MTAAFALTRGRETIVRTKSTALRQAHATLDRLESAWRGRTERIDQILDQPENGDPRCL